MDQVLNTVMRTDTQRKCIVSITSVFKSPCEHIHIPLLPISNFSRVHYLVGELNLSLLSQLLLSVFIMPLWDRGALTSMQPRRDIAPFEPRPCHP